MSSNKAVPTSYSGTTTLVVETTEHLRGRSFKISAPDKAVPETPQAFRRVSKARRQRDATPEAFASWVSEVVDEGTGVIVVRTATGGEHRLEVRNISRDEDVASIEPPMHPDVSQAVARARARGAETAAHILDQAHMLSGEVIGERMGMSRQAVDKARKAGKLLAVEGAKRGFRYPEWQLDHNGVRRSGLLEVLDLVGNDWEAYRFFMAQEDGILNQSLLIQGEVEELLRRAKLWTSANYA